MTTIFQIANKIKSINLDLLMEDAIRANEDNINKLNREQLEKGINSEGQKITPKYKSDVYAKRKQKLNSLPSFGTPDLKITGNLHDEIGVIVEGRDVFINSFDPKVKFKSIKQYDNLFGLTKENKSKNRNINNRTLVKLFKQESGL